MIARLAVIAVVLVALAMPAVAPASWNNNSAGGAATKARVIADGNTPTTSVSGRNVTVSWTASTISGGGPDAAGYIVKRYDTGGSLQSIGSSCSATIVALTCTESNVPAGNWKYSVTPTFQNWRGGEGSQSVTRTVNAASYTLSSSNIVAGLPSALSGNLADFMTGQTVTYRLDNASSGTVLGATTAPSTIATAGTATNSVTIPGGTLNGAHTIYAIGSGGDQASVSITVSAPLVTATVIDKTTGCASGNVKQAGTYFVYANVTGSPASVSANVSNITSGQTAVNLVAGSYTVNGTAYNYRSASLTATTPLTAGSKSYTVTPAAGTVANGSVTVDNTQPAASDVQTANKAGNIAGRPETGDTITYTFSEAIDPCSLVAGWNGTGTTNVVVRINDNSSADPLLIFNSTNTTQLPLGSVNTINSVGASRTFGLTGTLSTMSMSGNTVTVTLGTASSAANTQGSTTLIWTPSITNFDRAGNVNTATAATQSGGPKINF